MELGKFGGYLVGVVVLILGVFGFGYFGSDGGEEGIRVASFNGQIFGDSKISKVGVEYYVDLVSGYDLFFLLEIRDKDGSSFREVCSGLEDYGYSCLVSERAGRSSSKEQVGVVWDASVLNVSSVYSVEDEGDLFEREPVVVLLDSKHQTGRADSPIEFWVVHLKPANVSSELASLERAIGDDLVGQSSGEAMGTVVIGDLNADCDYYDREEGVHFDSWDWVIGDGEDTTTGRTDCAYDRIVVSGVKVLGSGVVAIDEEVSDHHLVWARFAGD